MPRRNANLTQEDIEEKRRVTRFWYNWTSKQSAPPDSFRPSLRSAKRIASHPKMDKSGTKRETLGERWQRTTDVGHVVGVEMYDFTKKRVVRRKSWPYYANVREITILTALK